MYEEEILSFDDILHAVESGFAQDGEYRNIFEARKPITVQSLNRRNPWYEKTLRHAETVERFRSGDLDQMFFPLYRRSLETISRDDFSQLTANLLYWTLLPLYAQEDNKWEQMVKIRDTIADFRQITMTRIEGGDGPLPQVPELSDYPMVTMTASDKSYKLAKYGEIVALSWEATFNDYLGMFNDWPKWLASGARATENKLVTGFLAASTGPNPTLFSTDGSTTGGVVNKIAGASTGTLNEANLIQAYINMTTQKVASGNPMMVTPRYLVVPPALRFAAEKLLESPTLIPAVIATTGTQNLISGLNVIPKLGLTVIENRWLNTVDTTNPNVTWYLLAEPNVQAAIEVGFLTGHRTPQVFQKVSGAQTGGAASDPAEGDFEHDARAWKIRHVLGGIALEPRYAYAMVGA